MSGLDTVLLGYSNPLITHGSAIVGDLSDGLVGGSGDAELVEGDRVAGGVLGNEHLGDGHLEEEGNYLRTL